MDKERTKSEGGLIKRGKREKKKKGDKEIAKRE